MERKKKEERRKKKEDLVFSFPLNRANTIRNVASLNRMTCSGIPEYNGSDVTNQLMSFASYVRENITHS